MKLKLFDKSWIPLGIMILVLAAGAVFLSLSFGAQSIEGIMGGDRIINMLFVVEQDGKPVSTQLAFLYPRNHRCAILDLPNDTGLIIQSLKRTDAISVLYSQQSIDAYRAEIEKLTGAKFPYYLIVTPDGLRRIGDLLDGYELFVPNEVRIPAPGGDIVIPSGVSELDGGKFSSFSTYKEEEESYIAEVERRQLVFKTLIKRIGLKASLVTRDDAFPLYAAAFRTNLDAASMKLLAAEFGRIETDRIATQRVNGYYRVLDGKPLLFPVYEGDLIPTQVSQTLNALPRSGVFDIEDRVFQVEIMNGTEIKGLAKKTADLFSSFGYQVLSYGNADKIDYERTVVYDRFGNAEGAKSLGDLINCAQIVTGDDANMFEGSSADFIILLGKDFNGRTCVE